MKIYFVPVKEDAVERVNKYLTGENEETFQTNKRRVICNEQTKIHKTSIKQSFNLLLS